MRLAEFFVEIGVVADIGKLDKIENSFKKLYGMAALNAKTLSKTLPGLAKMSKGIADNQEKTFKTAKKHVPFFEKMTKNLARNTTKVNKGIQAIEMTASELGLEMGGWPAIIAVGAIALGGMYYAMDRLVKKGSQLYINTRNIGLQTGLNRKQLLEWQQVAKVANPNMDASQVLQSISAIQMGIASIRLGMGNVKPYQLLGMSIVNQDAFGVLEQLRKKAKEFQGDKKAWFTLLATQMGVSPGMINVLRLSDKLFDKYRKIPLVSKQNQESLVNLRQDMKLLDTEFGNFFSSTLGVISPELDDVVIGLQKLMSWLTRVANYVGKINLDFLTDAKNDIEDVYSTMKKIANFANAPKGAKTLEHTVGGFFSKISKGARYLDKKIPEAMSGFFEDVGAPLSNLLAPMARAAGAITHHTTVNNTIHVTGENPEETGFTINNITQRLFENTLSQSNNGPKSS